MLVDPSNPTAGATVTGAIRQAAQATGTSFQYLLATAQVESGLNPQAGAVTSSARGLFQFIDQTWLATIKQSGAALGYGQYAAAITKTASGHYEVADPFMRSEILKLRNDPTANATMAGAFTQSNAAVLAAKIGRPPSEGELYIAHFMGAGGAARLISSAAANPNASAASYFPIAAHANTSIFYDRSTGAPRTLAEVRNVLTARYDVAARSRPSAPASAVAQADIPPANIPPANIPSAVAATRPASSDELTPHVVRTFSVHPPLAAPTPAPAQTPVAAATVPDTAGMTSAFADANQTHPPLEDEIFHGLFQDSGRTGPVAAVVSQLWGVSNTPASAGGTATPSAATLLNL
ncbi:MAG: transglycosylase SLT domain-containing protein, partial [Xanthobacteraceae bacterium]